MWWLCKGKLLVYFLSKRYHLKTTFHSYHVQCIFSFSFFSKRCHLITSLPRYCFLCILFPNNVILMSSFHWHCFLCILFSNDFIWWVLCKINISCTLFSKDLTWWTFCRITTLLAYFILKISSLMWALRNEHFLHIWFTKDLLFDEPFEFCETLNRYILHNSLSPKDHIWNWCTDLFVNALLPEYFYF